MKRNVSFPFLFVALLFFISCSKSNSPDNNTVVNGQTPFQTAVKDRSLVTIKSVYSQNSGGGEAGYRLHFTKNGTVTQLGSAMATVGTYQVSFWRTSDRSLLATTKVVITDTSKFFYTAITPVNVIKDTSYTLSFHNPDALAYPHFIYYNSPFRYLYPFTVGNVVADQVLDLINLPKNTSTPTYPYTVYSSDQAYLTDVDLVYQPIQ
jgi:hypothetical protein